MKRRIFVVLMALIMVMQCVAGISVHADAAEILASGSCGEDLHWTVDDAGTLTFSGTGEVIQDESWWLWGWNAQKVILEPGISGIGYQGLAGLEGLTEITLPDTLRNIGERAFAHCENLKSITIPGTVKTIGDWAFHGCTNLEEVVMESGIENIGMHIFFDCLKLSRVVLPEDMETVPFGILSNNDGISAITIPESVSVIEGYAFFGIDNLTMVTIPKDVTKIGSFAFANTSSLTTVVFKGDCPEADGAFYCASFNAVGFYPKDNATWENNWVPDLMALIPYTVDKNGNIIPEVPDAGTIEGGFAAMQQVYPEGSTYPDAYRYTLNGNMLTVSGSEAFAFEMSDRCFGYLPISEPRALRYADLKLGDILYTADGVWVITELTSSGVRAAGVDVSGIVCYDKTMTKAQVESAEAYRTRYGVSPYGGETDPALTAQKITAPEGIPTEAQVYERIMALQTQYPEGMPYSEKNHYVTNFVIHIDETLDYSQYGHGCSAFGGILSDTAFGDLPARFTPLGQVDLDQIMVGDLLIGNGHEMVITEVYTNCVVVAEGNYDGRVHWGRTLKRDEVESQYELVTRYPEGTVPGERTELVVQGGVVGNNILETGETKRVSGATRYETAISSADTLKENLRVEKFDAVIVASGINFADALAGSYLAAMKHAPILIVNGSTMNSMKEYIKENLVPGGTVYLLGGTAAVGAAMEQGLDSFQVKRLAGNTRYETNLAILKEAGVAGKDIIVCTGKDFADSLSASAVGLPILLVKDGLTAEQKEFLTGCGSNFIIVGGEKAVTPTVEKQLKTYGSVKRLAGSTRYETSVMVAKEFFEAPSTAVLAYAQNFPDGLCGGPLAYSMGAPLILTASGKQADAQAYTETLGIQTGLILGGTTLINDKVANSIF